VNIRLRFEVRQQKKGLCVSFAIQNVVGTPVLSSNIRDTDPAAAERIGVGLHTFEITIPPRLLAPTSYVLSVGSQVELSGFLEQQVCCEFTLRELSMAIHPRGDVLALLLPWDHQTGPLKKTLVSTTGQTLRSRGELMSRDGGGSPKKTPIRRRRFDLHFDLQT